MARAFVSLVLAAGAAASALYKFRDGSSIAWISSSLAANFSAQTFGTELQALYSEQPGLVFPSWLVRATASGRNETAVTAAVNASSGQRVWSAEWVADDGIPSDLVLIANDTLIVQAFGAPTGLNASDSYGGALRFICTETGAVVANVSLGLKPWDGTQPSLALALSGDEAVLVVSTSQDYGGGSSCLLGLDVKPASPTFLQVLWRQPQRTGLHVDAGNVAPIFGPARSAPSPTTGLPGQQLLLVTNLTSLVAIVPSKGIMPWSAPFPYCKGDYISRASAQASASAPLPGGGVLFLAQAVDSSSHHWTVRLLAESDEPSGIPFGYDVVTFEEGLTVSPDGQSVYLRVYITDTPRTAFFLAFTLNTTSGTLSEKWCLSSSLGRLQGWPPTPGPLPGHLTTPQPEDAVLTFWQAPTSA